MSDLTRLAHECCEALDLDPAEFAVPIEQHLARAVAALTAETARLREEVELHKDLLADEREELRHAVDTENRLTARVAALEAALRTVRGWAEHLNECDPWYGEQQTPTFREDMNAVDAALARTTPTPQGEQG